VFTSCLIHFHSPRHGVREIVGQEKRFEVNALRAQLPRGILAFAIPCLDALRALNRRRVQAAEEEVRRCTAQWRS
jgi:hypothetical protein